MIRARVFLFLFSIDHSTSTKVATVHPFDVPIALARRRSDRQPNFSSYRNYSWCSVAYRRGSSSLIAISITGTNRWLDNDWKISVWSKVRIGCHRRDEDLMLLTKKYNTLRFIRRCDIRVGRRQRTGPQSDSHCPMRRDESHVLWRFSRKQRKSRKCTL